MSRALRIQYPNAYYHVTCRGNEQKEIFRGVKDRAEFIELLARSIELFEIHLLAYALMPNHFHLLVCTPKGNLSGFMRHFNISYTGYFNRRYKRSGHLYQGRYKAFLIDADNYLLEVSRYIHLNPLRMESHIPLKQRWRDLLISDSTSLPGYIDVQHRKPIVLYATILDYFVGDVRKRSNDYKAFMAEGMEKDIPNPLEQGKGTGIIGEKDFVEKFSQLYCKDHRNQKSKREQPALRKLDKIATPEEIIDRYAQLVKLNREELTTKGKQSNERIMLMELLYRFCNITQPEIGKLLGGIDYSAVSQARKRLYVKMQNEPEWAERFRQIQEKIRQMSRVKI
ncbi:MAG: transposase [Smithella sp.]|nr:transposase [Smithella sp.]